MKEFYHQWHKLVPSRKEGMKEEKLGYFDLMSKTVDLMMEQQTKLNLMHHHPDILVEISRESAGTYDFYKAEELVGIGRLAFLKSIKEA